MNRAIKKNIIKSIISLIDILIENEEDLDKWNSLCNIYTNLKKLEGEQ